jgi:hypothetical protein
VSHKHLGDNDMDAVVLRALARMPRPLPSLGFADRVMARVRLPQPRAVVLMHRVRSWALEPRRALALAGAYAVAATIALGFSIPWLIQHSATIRAGTDWLTVRTSGVAREWMLTAASWAMSTGLTDLFKSLSLTGGRLWVAAGALTAGYAACALGLHFLLRAPRGTNGAVPVSQ